MDDATTTMAKDAPSCSIFAHLDATRLQARFTTELGNLQMELATHTEELLQQQAILRGGLVQRVVMSRASQLATRLHAALVVRAAEIQRQRRELLRTLERRIMATSPTSPATSGKRKEEEKLSTESVWAEVAATVSAEANTTAFVWPVGPTQEAFRHFAQTALVGEALHRRYAREGATATPSSSCSGEAVERGLQRLLESMELHPHPQQHGSVTAAAPLLFSEAEVVDADAEELPQLIRLPAFESLEAFLCEAPWAAEVAMSRYAESTKSAPARAESKTASTANLSEVLGFSLLVASSGNSINNNSTTGEGANRSTTQEDSASGEVAVESICSTATWWISRAVDQWWARLPPPQLDGVAAAAMAAGADEESAAARVMDEEEPIVEDFLGVLRTRYAVEVAAHVVALQASLGRLRESEDAVVLGDGGREMAVWAPDAIAAAKDGGSSCGGGNKKMSTDLVRGATHMTITVLTLPGMEQLFFCVAHVLGTALQQEVRAAVDAGTGLTLPLVATPPPSSSCSLAYMTGAMMGSLRLPSLAALRLWLYFKDFVMDLSPRGPFGTTSDELTRAITRAALRWAAASSCWLGAWTCPTTESEVVLRTAELRMSQSLQPTATSTTAPHAPTH